MKDNKNEFCNQKSQDLKKNVGNVWSNNFNKINRNMNQSSEFKINNNKYFNENTSSSIINQYNKNNDYIDKLDKNDFIVSISNKNESEVFIELPELKSQNRSKDISKLRECSSNFCKKETSNIIDQCRIRTQEKLIFNNRENFNYFHSYNEIKRSQTKFISDEDYPSNNCSFPINTSMKYCARVINKDGVQVSMERENLPKITNNSVILKRNDCIINKKFNSSKGYETPSVSQIKEKKSCVKLKNSQIQSCSRNAQSRCTKVDINCLCLHCRRKQVMFSEVSTQSSHFLQYKNDIYESMLRSEDLFLPCPQYMKFQTNINDKMRGILINWIVEVHSFFKFVPETLYLTVNIIDRFLLFEIIHRDKLQLIGVTALWIACKYEEVYSPNLKEITATTDGAYEEHEVMEMEILILQKLDFNISTSSSYNFLECYCKTTDETREVFFFSQYLMELSLIEYSMIRYKPSIISAAAFYISRKMAKRDQPWSKAIEKMFKLVKQEVKNCAKELLILKSKMTNSKLEEVTKKFLNPLFCEVAKFQIKLSQTKNSNKFI